MLTSSLATQEHGAGSHPPVPGAGHQNPTKPKRTDKNTAATAPTHASKTQLPPLAAWQFVKKGNAAFVRAQRPASSHKAKINGAHNVTKTHHDAAIGAPEHAAPIAKRPAGANRYVCAVITCADLDGDIPKMLGLARKDLLVLRMPGPFVNAEAVALLDRTVTTYKTSLILVLSHSHCDSLKLRKKGADDALDRRVAAIRAAARNGQRSLQEAIGPQQRELLLASSSTMRNLVKRDRLRIIPGTIETKTGAIQWLQRRAQELPLSPVK